MAALCQAVYLDPAVTDANGHERARLLAEHGFSELHCIDNNGVKAMVVESDGYLVLVFRGTDSLDNWTSNVQFFAADWPGGGQAHKGFIDAFDDVAAELTELRQRWPERPWMITGHSLGAVLAVMSCPLIRPTGAYGFGCPNIGNEPFVQSLSGFDIFQLINGRDLVTTLPPSIGYLRYHRPGTVYYLDGVSCHVNPENKTFRPGSVDLDLLIDRAVNVSEWKDPVKDLYDHSIVNYMVAIEALL